MFYFFPALSLIFALVQIVFFHHPVVETLLASILFFVVGLGGLFAFTGHFFKPDEVAEKIGFPKGNPFQTEIAFTNLGYAITGIMAMWIREGFWLAIVIYVSIFYLGAAYVHLKEFKEKNNKNELNIGFPLFTDLIVPVVIITLETLYILKV